MIETNNIKEVYSTEISLEQRDALEASILPLREPDFPPGRGIEVNVTSQQNYSLGKSILPLPPEEPQFDPQFPPGGGIELVCGTDGDDQIYGSFGSTIYGYAGNDIIYGGGNSFITGGTGNDTIHSIFTEIKIPPREMDGILPLPDTQVIYVGDCGDNTYCFASGDGCDTISRSHFSSPVESSLKTDISFENTEITFNHYLIDSRILFDASVAYDNISLFQSDHNLVIGYGTNDTITVLDQMNRRQGHMIGKIELDNGLFLGHSDIYNVLNEITTFANSHGISLTSVNDVKNNSDLMHIISHAWHA